MKHNPGVDFESLDFEVVHKEMEAEEDAEEAEEDAVVAATAAEGNAPKVEDEAPEPVVGKMPLLYDIIA